MTSVDMAARTAATESNSSPRWMGLTGVLFALLLAPAVLMTSGMPQAQHAAKVQQWDIKHEGLLGLSFILTTIAVIVGLCFLVWLHSRLSRGNSGWIGNLFFAGVVTFALSGVLSAGVNASLAQDSKHLSTDSLQLMASISQNLTFPTTSAGLAVMYFAVGFLIRRSGVLPGWLAWVSWLFALLATTVLLGFIPLIGSALWMIIAGIYLTVRPPAEG